MNLDNLLTALILIICFYVIFFIGKIVHDLLHREYHLTTELVEKDNPALALAVAGYYLGLVFCIGGVLTGPSEGILEDIIDLCIYGLLGIVLLNASWYICDLFILRKFKVSDELIRDQNQGVGAVSFGVSVASGLIIYGAVSGEGGTIWTAIAFWAIGQVMLILATLIHHLVTPYDDHEELEKDNVAVGVSSAGVLIAMGIVLGLAAEGDFSSWSEDIWDFLAIALLGLILLPCVRILTDKVLLPTVKLADEIAGQEKPNVGAAYIVAVSYISAALVISWCV
ncbi:MAG: DUF350 domain-containing protein [Desulfobacterales bacterium]